jgi:FixJ family two-component response regulator
MVEHATRSVVGVVEDDDSARTAISRVLRAGGFEPALFESAEAFIEAPPASALLCLVVDVQLSGMSGIDLQSHLRGCGCTVPIIVMTAHREEAIRNHAERNGCEAFLWKPFTADILLELIGSIVRRPQS